MHILFFSHYFPPEGNAPASRTYENCKRWVRRGHTVTVITSAPNHPDGVLYPGYKNKLRQREIVDGIEVIRVWTYLAANKGSVRRIANYLSYMFSAVFFSLFVRRPDMIIGTSPQFFCGWAGVIASFLRRRPFILEIRDIWPESILVVGAISNQRLIRFLEYLELKMYASADHIVTVGEGYRQRLLEKSVPEEKISIVMNGVDTDLFFPREPDPSLIERYSLGKRFVCSYVGTIGMACGLAVVLRAAQILKERRRQDIVFLLVGDGAIRQDLQAEAELRGLDNIIFTGRQPKEQMPNFLSITGACLIHLKKTDLFTTVMPSKIFEAAGMAKPIIIGVAGFASQVVLEAGAGIAIAPENEKELVEKLEALADNPHMAEGMGRCGHESIVANYNRDALAEKYLSIIQSVGSGD